MKGIILAGGSGSRLKPTTDAISKQLIPIYDKPMVYYPLSVLMLSEIKEILIISTKEDIPLFKKLLGDGSNYGLSIEYKVQEKPNGIAEAFIIGSSFIKDDSVCLILGDNIFYGENFTPKLIEAASIKNGAIVFSYLVNNPEDFGVIEFDENKNVINIEEKPKKPKSNYAVTGLYYYDNQVIEIAKSLEPSKRGELEISDLNNVYLEKKQLKSIQLSRGFAWLDSGTYDSMLQASQFIETIEKRQGIKVACLEEIAFNKGWIDKTKLLHQAKKLEQTSYGKYLEKLIE